jgi:amidase
MNLEEYASYDALGLADLVRRRKVAAAELRDLGMQAIELLNPTLNAVVATMPEEAEAALERLTADAPFAGVPFLIKDIGAAYQGVPSEAGCRLMKGHVSPHDSELCKRYKRAGLVAIGRTTTPEIGNNVSTESLATGPTRNPWNTGLSPGGSSGGSAAAVAAGIAPMGHAADGAGSIRVPAANCGLFGLKPSRGRNPTGPDLHEILFGLVNDHVVTRSVRDSAALLDATAGSEIGGRLLLPAPSGTFLSAAQRDPKRLRIAFSAEPPGRGGGRAHADCVAMTHDVAALCESLGHEVSEAAPDIDIAEVTQVFLEFAAAAVRQMVVAARRETGRPANHDTLEATTLRILEYAESRSAAQFVETFDLMHRTSRILGEFFTSCDVWLSPIMAFPPPVLGLLNADDPNLSAFEWMLKVVTACPYVAMFNQSGQPALSIPLYWNADGLPIGTQLAGRLGDEETLLSLSGQLERARPWAQRCPGVHVAGRGAQVAGRGAHRAL